MNIIKFNGRNELKGKLIETGFFKLEVFMWIYLKRFIFFFMRTFNTSGRKFMDIKADSFGIQKIWL